MKRMCGGLAAALMLSAVCAGCVTGKVLNFPGDLARPGMPGIAAPAANPVVAVFDFSWAAPASQEIGRDYYSVRPIVWKGAPGKALADLVSEVLNEKGIPAIRVSADAGPVSDALVRVTGTVEEFRVDGKKVDLVRAENTAHVVLSVSATAPGGQAPFTTHLASDYRDQEALVVTPDGVRDAMSGAANAAAEEAVRRLIASGVLPAPPPRPAGDAVPGQERAR